ncbi:MAG: hypothetical protein ACLUKQ_05015 [Peptococcaceae bacterium]
MKKHVFFIGLLALLIVLLLAGCGGAPAPQAAASEQKVAIRLATDYRKDSIGYQQLEDFARILQEKSQNTIVVSLYGSGEWSQAYSFVDYIKLGSLEMACLKPAEMLRLQPAYELYQQPYLFTSLQAVESYISGDAGKKALQTLPPEYYGIGFVPDGYQYLLDDGQLQWLSYGELKQKGQTKALGESRVYDLRAVYSLQPVVTLRSWWDALTEEQQGWIQESFAEAITASFAQQVDKDPAQTLLSNSVVFEDSTAPAWSSYYNLYLNQREEYFAAHSDSLTAYWRPVVEQAPTVGEEK